MSEGRVDLAVVVGLVLTGAREEIGQLRQQNVQFDGTASDRNGFDALAPGCDLLQDGKLDRGKALDLCELNPSPASRVSLAAVRR